MKMWARRYRDLGSLWTQTVCRLHAVFCDLVPGGFARRISVPQAIQLLETIDARTPADTARVWIWLATSSRICTASTPNVGR